RRRRPQQQRLRRRDHPDHAEDHQAAGNGLQPDEGRQSEGRSGQPEHPAGRRSEEGRRSEVMRRAAALIAAAGLVLAPLPAVAPRGHAALSVVEIDAKTGAGTVSHRLPAHDAEPALAVIAPDAQASLDDPEAVEALKSYVAKRFSVSVNDAAVAL